MSTVWKPVGTNLIESPTWIVVPCGKKSLTSASWFWNAFCCDVGRPMSTVFVAALAAAGTASTPIAAAVNAALDLNRKGAPLGRICDFWTALADDPRAGALGGWT